MKKILVLLLAAVFATAGLAAQEKAEKKAKKASAMKEDRWSGNIIRSSKENSTLTVGKGTIEKMVIYDSSTKWTKQGTKPADMADFKDGSRVICMGKYDEKGRLVATRIDLRPPR